MSTKTLPNTEQPTHVRILRANVLRTISRLCYAIGHSELPAPSSIRFLPHYGEDAPKVEIRFDALADAQRWADRLDAGPSRVQSHARIRAFYAEADWLGYQVQISGVEPIGDDR